MKRGDLITTMFEDISIFDHWGYDSSYDRRAVPGVIGKFTSGSFAILLEDGLERGGNGVKILTSCGTVGWVYRSEVDVVK